MGDILLETLSNGKYFNPFTPVFVNMGYVGSK